VERSLSCIPIDTAMVANYFKIALRTLKKYKGSAFINIAGLMIGLVACVLILLFVRDELSYDRYHEHADQIYRVNQRGAIGGSFIYTATSPAPMAPTLVQEYPEVLGGVLLSGITVVFLAAALRPAPAPPIENVVPASVPVVPGTK
jgi:hypothetical protein